MMQDDVPRASSSIPLSTIKASLTREKCSIPVICEEIRLIRVKDNENEMMPKLGFWFMNDKSVSSKY